MVGLTEVILVAISIALSLDGRIIRLDAMALILLWALSIIVLSRFGEEKIISNESVSLPKPEEKFSRLAG